MICFSLAGCYGVLLGADSSPGSCPGPAGGPASPYRVPGHSLDTGIPSALDSWNYNIDLFHSMILFYSHKQYCVIQNNIC